jgi:hypothetical protein
VIVRKTLCDHLKRIGTHAPHAVCYAALAALNDDELMAHSQQGNSDATGNSNEAVTRTHTDESCNAQICAHLRQLHPMLMTDARQIVTELRRMHTLRAELWYNAVQPMLNEMNKFVIIVRAHTNMQAPCSICR